MVENIQELEFVNFVVIANERAIFGRAYAGDKIHHFLIGTQDRWVKEQRNQQWIELHRELAEAVRARAQTYYGKVPTRRLKRGIL
jgi:hypothetical protein